MSITTEQLAEALRARADWLDLPRDVETPRPYISRQQFRAAAAKLDEIPSLIAEVERLREALHDIEGKCADTIGGRINYRAGDLQIIARRALLPEEPT